MKAWMSRNIKEILRDPLTLIFGIGLAGVLHTNNACSFMSSHIASCKGRQKAPSAEGAVSRRLTEDTPSPRPQTRLARSRRLCQPP